MRRLMIILLMLAGVSHGLVHAQDAFTIPGGHFLALSYHDVRDDVQPGRDADPYAVSTQRLVEWFDWMERQGWRPVSLQQIVDAREGREPLPANAVLLTFDDGLASVYSHVFPLLQAYEYPALVALQTGWLETVWAGEDVTYNPETFADVASPEPAADQPPPGTVTYNEAPLGAEGFLALSELREMQASGLVEFASHSHDLHRGILANPQGNEQPAAITRRYDPESGRYEDHDTFRQRILDDMRASSASLEAMVGVAPRAIVWPYGAHSAEVDALATEAGMPWSISLGADPVNHPEQARVNRLLISGDPRPVQIAQSARPESATRATSPQPQRVVHVDLDYVYDPDPEQTNRNLGVLLDRIQRMQVRTVYLQAFADPNGDGNADALYFPNRHLPVRADLFNRVAWQLRTRAGVRVYAWMPLLSFDLPDRDLHAALSVRRPGPEGAPVPADRDYRRLSPFLPRSLEIVGDIYADLGMAASGIAGVLIHDDAYLAADEDLAACQGGARWPGTDRPLSDCTLRPEEKTQALIDFGDEVIGRLRYFTNLSLEFRTARNLYARVILEPEAEERFAQALPAAVEAYDEVAIMAMPWLDGTELPPDVWLARLADAVEEQIGGFEDVVFELQARDWRGEGRWLEATLLRDWMEQLVRRGVLNFGYYPDDFLRDQPEFGPTFEGMSLNAFPHPR
ncbi:MULTISPECIES: poly-beta-1,6-N-acetyl-D-glucosamine N-deacetylase PgaB [unclassified Thioalkalivibrio]|uniref:poly-beta-1,6-N-acetyl-D-glucosamine N-deacetylase PgaB n=1 Tax=unclassified Thioalkalivibrio TaxID=2621013 RepID=UPI000377B287|nr:MULTISPECIES: poly-beta-1,6-N-acetyl-D-glucosamine N-deacetylase PgaB [unclassified Thioalkalivibrio]